VETLDAIIADVASDSEVHVDRRGRPRCQRAGRRGRGRRPAGRRLAGPWRVRRSSPRLGQSAVRDARAVPGLGRSRGHGLNGPVQPLLSVWSQNANTR
jgi:hypothetical protein